jgi:Tol biopolymer transport system component
MRLDLTGLWITLTLSVFSFSTYGRQLVFPWPGEGAARSLATINVDGSGYQALPESLGSVETSWSPDGRFMLFATPEAQGGLKLYDPNKKTTRSVRKDLQGPMAWREDGKRFVAARRTQGEPIKLVWFDLADNDTTFRLELPASVTSLQKILWLPETDDVAFLAGDGNIYLAEAGEVKKVTTSNDVLTAALSQDETKLLWARKSPNTKYILLSLYAYDLKSRSVVRMPFPERVKAINPDPRNAPSSVQAVEIAPDGVHLALVTLHEGTGAGRYYAAYTVKIDGEGGSLLDQTEPVKPACAGEVPFDVTWSPDGKRLAVLRTEPDGRSLTLYNADGSNPRVLKTDLPQ